MYAKYVNETAILFPPYEKDGVINYNSDTNSEQLLRDGYLTFIDSDDPGELKNPQKRYKIENNKIIAYFVEGEDPSPTEEEMKEQVRAVRNSYLSYWDFTQLDDAPFTEEEKAFYREYRQYLRDYTEQENWWLQNPDNYETWLVAHHPVTNS